MCSEKVGSRTSNLDSPTGKQIRAHALSTRAIHTRDGSTVSFARSALESMVDQVEENDVWCVVEHLTFLPPVARWVRGEIQECDDGEADLYLYADELSSYMATVTLDLDSLVTSLPVGSSPSLSPSIRFDRRSFDPEVAEWIEQDSDGLASPVEQWSEFPPLVYILTVPAVWAGIRFLGSFLDELGRAAGMSLASKLSSWTKRRKETDRKIVFELEFVCHDGASVSGFVITGTDDVESSVKEALSVCENLATLAGLHNDGVFLPEMRKAAFFLQESEWTLGWWTDGDRVVTTRWFKENPPDAEGVLGRPLQ